MVQTTSVGNGTSAPNGYRTDSVLPRVVCVAMQNGDHRGWSNQIRKTLQVGWCHLIEHLNAHMNRRMVRQDNGWNFLLELFLQPIKGFWHQSVAIGFPRSPIQAKKTKSL